MFGQHNPIDLSLIIVNYNVRDFLEALLRSVTVAIQDLTVEIIVVDNHSTDGSVEMMRSQYPDVQVIENTKNPGFAAANNQALQCYQGRYACLVNPDVLLQEDSLVTMVTFMDQNPDVGAAGCKVLNSDGSLQLACRRSIPTPMSAFFKLTGLSRLFPKNRLIGAYNMTYLDPDQPHDVDAVSGSFMVVRRKTIDEVGGLDDTFFMYGEDLDWFYRMRQNRWRVCYVPQTQIVHYKGESSKRSRRRLSVEFYRAMYLFARKHRAGYGLRIMTWPIQGLITIGIILKGVFSISMDLVQQRTILLIDLFLLNTTPLLATLIRIGHLTPLDENTVMSYLVVHGTYSLTWMSCLYLSGMYGHRRYSATAAAVAITIGLVLIAAITFFLPSFAFSRAVVLLAWGMNLITIAGWRWIASRLIGARRRTIILGTDEMARTIQVNLQHEMHPPYQVVGFLDSDPNLIGTKIQDVEVFNGNGQVLDTLDRHQVDEVIVASTSVTYHDILRLVSACTRLGIDLKLVSDDTQKSETYKTVSLVHIGDDPLTSLQRMLRRGLHKTGLKQRRTEDSYGDDNPFKN